MLEKLPRERLQVLALTALAVILMGLALVSYRWLLGKEGSLWREEIGLIKGNECNEEGNCGDLDYETLGPEESFNSTKPKLSYWNLMRYLTFGAGAASVVLLIIAAARPAKRLTLPLLVTLALGVVSAIGFIMLEPQQIATHHNTVPGHAFTMFLVGSLAGLLAVLQRPTE